MTFLGRLGRRSTAKNASHFSPEQQEPASEEGPSAENAPAFSAVEEPGSARRERPAARRARTLVVDFDGTITEMDLLDEIAQRFGDPEVYREVDERLDENRITLHEVLRREFEPVRAPLDDVRSWVLENVRVRAGFRDLVELAHERGWRFVIVSSGFRELIEPVLEREGVEEVELLSNSIDPDPDGWRVRFRDEDVCETCGEPCKRATAKALADGGELVYVGDGYSDRCAAESSDVVFARRGLAAYLNEQGIPFEPFDNFHEIAARLDP